MEFKVLVVDDEKSIRDIFSLLLEEKGYLVETAAGGKEGIARAEKLKPDVVLLDMNLPDVSGLGVMAEIKKSQLRAEIIIMTAYGTIRNAVQATKLGAYAYLEKPVDNEELLLILSRLFEVKRLAREVETLRSELSSRFRFSSIIGTSAKMNSVFQLMGKVAEVDGTVLVTGESGTGKELVARAIHYNSPRKNNAFVVVNCGAIPRDLIESEFFGHIKGAFTDARAEKSGKFEQAHKGTIFLDEVSELSQDAQVKLLRAIGEKEIVRVGGDKTIPVDVRVVAATNKDLEAQVRKGAFREDLYFRLAVLSIHLPALRERTEDIPLLCEHFIRKYSRELGKNVLACSPETLASLKAYSWPGNVRELENVIYEMTVLSEGPLLEAVGLPPRIRNQTPDFVRPENGTGLGLPDGPLSESVSRITREVEKRRILAALQETGGNKSLAARRLGISRKTLFNKMTSLGIRTRGRA